MIQVKEEFGKFKENETPELCWWRSSFMGFWNEFMDTDAEFIGIEAGGQAKVHANSTD